MAKKTRRARKASQARRVQQADKGQHESAPTAAVAATTTITASQSLRGATTAQAAVNFSEEYHYVLADLKRVGILALVMFGVLIGLAFLLPALGM